MCVRASQLIVCHAGTPAERSRAFENCFVIRYVALECVRNNDNSLFQVPTIARADSSQRVLSPFRLLYSPQKSKEFTLLESIYQHQSGDSSAHKQTLKQFEAIGPTRANHIRYSSSVRRCLLLSG